MIDHALLFAAALLAATIVPFSSEAVLFGLLQRDHAALALVATATAGNTLGSVVNWWLGRCLLRFKDARWFPFGEDEIETGRRRFERYGLWTLLFAWVPIGGDVLTLVAGILRVRLGVFVVLVGLGKLARYVVVVWLDGAIAGG